MTSLIQENAWSIIRRMAATLLDHRRIEDADAQEIEIVRLASLNHLLASCLNHTNGYIANLREAPFSRLSYASLFIGLDSEEILTDARRLLEMISAPCNEAKELPLYSLPDLLSQIHSLCSYHLSPVGRLFQKNLGAFYTPPEIAGYIVKSIIDVNGGNQKWRTTKDDFKGKMPNILDPACGTGAFLVAAFKVFSESYLHDDDSSRVANSAKILQEISERIYGVDLDAGSVEIADISLSLLGGERKLPMKSRQFGVTLKQGNALISPTGNDSEKRLDAFFENPSSELPFDWEKEFPRIFSDDESGFDVVVVNPPYERLKPNRTEFGRHLGEELARRYPSLSFANDAQRIKEKITYFRKSDQYEYANVYSMDTYRLFIERSLQLLRNSGKFGFIVPSTLAGDLASKEIRRYLFIENSLSSLDFFKETADIFPDVSQAFCVMVGNKGGSTSKIDLRFGLNSIDQLTSIRSYQMHLDEMARIVGFSLVVPRIESFEWEILKQMHTHPTVAEADWILNHRGELDLTLDKEFLSDKEIGPRLLKGSDIGRYALRASETSYSPKYVRLRDFRQSKTKSVRLGHIDSERIACQQINNQHQKWRLKFAKVNSGFVLANSCNYLTVTSQKSRGTLLNYLLGLMNSELMNWRFSATSYNNHVSNRELDTLPVPNPMDSEKQDETMKEIANLASRASHRSQDLVPKIESLVFKLFDIRKSTASKLLDSRGLGEQQISNILNHM
ncbi:hypothetical protein EU537_09835 [Candidatus Thorarchaeota archaeon]|nr:MAG: hypothetical protein EU537_09835 [Candidatus Thorarchaeota archaeon]